MKKLNQFSRAALSLLLAACGTTGAYAATDPSTYGVKNGLSCTNLWLHDLKNTGTFISENLPFLECPDRVRSAAIDVNRGLVVFGYSKPVTYIENSETVSINTAHLVTMNLYDGSGYKEIMLTLDGEPIKGLLCANQVGVDNFGHIWFCGYSATTSTSPVKLYMVDNFETGECSLVAELLLPAEEATTADGRMDYASLIGDITGVEAPCTVMWALSNNYAKCHRWVREQGSDEWVGGFDGFVSNENDFETYPAKQIWNTAPSVTMILDDEFSGSMFYVDGNNTCPSLYDTSGALLESFAAFASDEVNRAFIPSVAPNGVGEFAFGDDMYMVYAVNQPNAGVTSAELRAVKLGAGGTFEGMEELWMLPAKNGLGDTNDGLRYHAIDIRKVIDSNGKEAVYLLTYKCKNGVGVYRIAGEGFNDILATAISLDKSEMSLAIGQQETLMAMVLPNDVTNSSVTWTSSDESIVTVSAAGVVTAIAGGTATITAMTNDGSNLKAECKVSVSNNGLRIDGFRIKRSSQVYLPVIMENDSSITAFQCDIHLPDGITFAMVDGKLDIYLDESRKGNDHTLDWSYQPDGSLRLLSYSLNVNEFIGNTGPLFHAKLNIADTVAEGKYNIEIKNIKLSGIRDDKYCAHDVTAAIEVYAYDNGDANGDNIVDVIDIVTIAKYILETSSGDHVTGAADVNKDGQIDVFDIVALAKIILAQDENAETVSTDQYIEKSGNTISVDNFSMSPGETKTIEIFLENTDSFTAFQMDVKLPEGLTLTGSQLSSRSDDTHVIQSKNNEDGTCRLISFSPSLALYRGKSGALLSLTLTANNNFVDDKSIELTNVVFADSMANGYILLDAKADISSIASVDNVASQATKLYTMNNMLVIETPCDTVASITTVNGIVRSLAVSAGINEYLIDVPGMYIVSVNGINRKIGIK